LSENSDQEKEVVPESRGHTPPSDDFRFEEVYWGTKPDVRRYCIRSGAEFENDHGDWVKWEDVKNRIK